jgi:hypothetical protein
MFVFLGFIVNDAMKYRRDTKEWEKRQKMNWNKPIDSTTRSLTIPRDSIQEQRLLKQIKPVK